MVLPASGPAYRTAWRLSAVIFKLHSNLSKMIRLSAISAFGFWRSLKLVARAVQSVEIRGKRVFCFPQFQCFAQPVLGLGGLGGRERPSIDTKMAPSFGSFSELQGGAIFFAALGT